MAELFTRLERAAWGGFVTTQGRIFQRIEEDLRRRFGITHAEFEVLLRLTLSKDGRARIQDLASSSLLTRSGTSRVVDRLVRAGHLTREGADEDGRGAYAVLSARGRDHFLAAAREHVALVREQFLSHFSRDEQELLAGFWARLSEARAARGGGDSPSAVDSTPRPIAKRRPRPRD
ncbi:MAG: MarR family transcriptional regulator [Polyangiaceae bacterium]